MSRFRPSSLQLRIAGQLVVLALFLVLFRLTDYRGNDELGLGINIFFQLNPLTALTAILASKELIPLFVPAIATLLVTIVLGRVFCGWFCPLGTLIDGFRYGANIKLKVGVKHNLHFLKYGLLVFVVVTALLGLQTSGYIDPFALLARGLAFSIDPLITHLVTASFTYLYHNAPTWVTTISEPVYSALKAVVLPYRQSYFSLSFVSFCLLIGIFLLEFLDRRFWCKNLCPLGALLALVSRYSFLRRRPFKKCTGCSTCLDSCRMNAFTHEGYWLSEECIRCQDCTESCAKGLIAFRFKDLLRARPTFSLSRRRFLGATAGGLMIPLLKKIRLGTHSLNPLLLRPPGALLEDQFLQKCVRCGECMKVCPQNALQPALMESGPEGMFSPHLVPRIGYCEFNCTLCGQVCPSGAIQALTPTEKQTWVIGKAWVDKSRCLPYSFQTACLVCEEHCPVHNKAIKVRTTQEKTPDGTEITVQQPYVEQSLCIGCGICEHVCPVNGPAAIKVYAQERKAEWL